jgi:gliding motility-associatede transport system auxiliary component
MIRKPGKLTLLSNTALGFIAFLGILVFVALIGQRHPMRLDLTESKRYSISDQSQKIVESLKDDINFKGFYQEADPNREQTRNLLETYRYYSKKINYQFTDPDRDPSLAKHYQIRTYGTLVLEGFGKTQTISTADEETITNAILKLTQEQQRTVYFLTGHGDRDISNVDKDGYSTAKGAIEKENFQVRTLNLLVDPKIPDDAALVVIADPQKPLLTTELGALRQYINRNGSVMFLLEPFSDGGVAGFLKSYGITISPDIIVDTMSRVFGASYLIPVITEYGFHKITDGFNVACFFPTTRSIDSAEGIPRAVDLLELAFTSSYSWAETDYRLGQPEAPKFDETKDRKGPISVAVIATISAPNPGDDPKSQEQPTGKPSEATDSGGQAQLLVFGDSDFASNSYFNLQGNSDFFLNAINFLGQQENLISIQRPRTAGVPLTLSKSQNRLLFWVGLLLMPALVVASGLAVFQWRRKHR